MISVGIFIRGRTYIKGSRQADESWFIKLDKKLQ